MNRVLVIRHAQAEEAADAAREGRSESQRRLTELGRRDMSKGVRGLRELQDELAIILTSPLKRAAETAAILHRAYPKAKLQKHKPLAPGSDPAELLRSLPGRAGPVALVGHEPDLSLWIGYLSTGESRSLVRMKKGSVCRLDMAEPAVAGEAEIAWLLTLKQLGKLAP
jgi:phosphohistidine phosphatase